jgi:hypothetical protein
MTLRPEDLTISGLPRRALPGGLKADAVVDLLKRAAFDLRSACARIEQLEAQVASLEADASTRKDPYEIGRVILASAHKMADEQRETHESELVLKKAEERAVRIELDAQRRLDDGSRSSNSSRRFALNSRASCAQRSRRSWHSAARRLSGSTEPDSNTFG